VIFHEIARSWQEPDGSESIGQRKNSVHMMRDRRSGFRAAGSLVAAGFWVRSLQLIFKRLKHFQQ